MPTIKTKKIQVDVSTWTFLKILILVLVIWFLYIIREILAILFFSLLLASAVDPFVDWLHRKKIPRAFGILFIYLVLLGIMSLIM